jgi:hypothetical protein
VTDFEDARPQLPVLTADDVVCRDSMGRALLEVAARAAGGRSAEGLDRVPWLGRRGGVPAELRWRALSSDARAEALPLEAADRLDADAVAEWITSHYPAPTYPAVVLGSPHGAAVHLAAALGAAWLPTEFAVTLPWPGGSAGDWAGALAYGAGPAGQIVAGNPAVTVRQVHDPVRRGPLCGSTLSLHVRWLQLPPAYRSFLRTRLAPEGASVLLRDIRTWPVHEVAPRQTFQIGSPVSGWRLADYTIDNPSFRRLLEGVGVQRWPAPCLDTPLRYAETAGEPELELDLRRTAAETYRPAQRVLYPNPESLSACVADLYRSWLGGEQGGGDRCVVETGRLLDPWQVLATGAVPYWCESASRRAVDAAEWWLAGSAAFGSVSVLPEPPGTACEAHADVRQWRSLAAFAGRRPWVDRPALTRYPLFPLPTGHAANLPPAVPAQRAESPRLSMARALSALRMTGAALGLLVV